MVASLRSPPLPSSPNIFFLRRFFCAAFAIGGLDRIWNGWRLRLLLAGGQNCHLLVVQGSLESPDLLIDPAPHPGVLGPLQLLQPCDVLVQLLLALRVVSAPRTLRGRLEASAKD